jgi:hypothetical protein
MAIPRNLANFAPKLDSSGNPTFTAPTVFSAGTASDPSITFTGDTNTGLFSPAADTIAFTEGGAEAMRITSDGRLGIGTTSPNYPLNVQGSGDTFVGITGGTSNVAALLLGDADNKSLGRVSYNNSDNSLQFWANGSERARIDSSGNVGIGTASPGSILDVNGTVTGGNFVPTANTVTGNGMFLPASNEVAFSTGGAERMRIRSGGSISVGKTGGGSTIAGIELLPGTSTTFDVVSERGDGGGYVVMVNRQTSDGALIVFRQADTDEGSISVSGSTVSYNGGHLSRWAQMLTKPDLVKGTVMSNLDEMNVYVKPTLYWTEDDELPVDEEGNPTVAVGDLKQETSVSENEQLNKVKVSDVEGDPNVAGVFVNWTYDEAHQVDEINMAMTGDMIIRIGEGVTVARGDLLMSAGDGTAKPQGDDIVRSKTIAKVTSTHVTCTYEDGSYCVPCVLMAC